MGFTEAEDRAFWPIYRDYDLEMSKLGDERVRLIRDYAAAFATLTDERAASLAAKALDLETRRNAAKAKCYEKVKTALSPRTALRFLQVEHQLQLLIDLQIAAALPVAPAGKDATMTDLMRPAWPRCSWLAAACRWTPTASGCGAARRSRACSSAATARPFASCSTTAACPRCRWGRRRRGVLGAEAAAPPAAARRLRPAAAPARPRLPPPAPRPAVTVPAGTPINVRLAQDIDVDVSQASQRFKAIVDDPVMVGGSIVIPRGASAYAPGRAGPAVRER